MPKMTHVIEGWALGSSPLAAGVKRPSSPQTARRPPEPSGHWHYQGIRRSRADLVFGILFSLSLHAVVFLGFNDPVPPPKHIAVADDPIIQMTMPDLEKDEIDPVEALGEDQPEDTPTISVPMLADLPSIVPVDAFVQQLDFTPALPANLDSVSLAAIPVNIARNSGSAERLGRIFNISELDRQPQPILQQSPVFPPELKKEYQEADVEMGFIINTKGEVLAPYVIKSVNTRFEEAAVRAILKWKFRPGYRGGRPVNTRTQITIKFRVIEGS